MLPMFWIIREAYKFKENDEFEELGVGACTNSLGEDEADVDTIDELQREKYQSTTQRLGSKKNNEEF